MELKIILDKLKKFNKDRNWEKFHTPQNLSCAISVEASELLELYQWGDTTHRNHDDVADEVADVLIYLLLLCDTLNIDLLQATHNKIAKNAKKYPKKGDE